MGTAGFGAELEHNLPIFVGGLSPEGLTSVDGLGIVDADVLTEDTSSDDADDAGGGASNLSLILRLTYSL